MIIKNDSTFRSPLAYWKIVPDVFYNRFLKNSLNENYNIKLNEILHKIGNLLLDQASIY